MLRRGRADPYHEPPPPAEPEPEPDGRRRYRVGGWRVTAVLLFFVLVFLAIGVLRVVGYDGNELVVEALALTPYVAPAGLLLALIAFALRRRLLAVGVLLIAASMVVLLLPRFLTNEQPAADGERVRVMSVNLEGSGANPADVVRAVRDNEIDVLTLPRLTPAGLAELDAAGLAERLPHRVLAPTGDAAIAARHPLRQIILVENSALPQPAAVVDLPGRDDLEILSVHVRSALYNNFAGWQSDLRTLPPTNPQRVRVLAGAFNAGFDHDTFRATLDSGYRDAAEQTGKGLIPTRTGFGPPITTDHILTDSRIAISRYDVLSLPDNTNDPILADLILP